MGTLVQLVDYYNFLLNFKMEDSKSEVYSSEGENRYLAKLIESNFKKNKTQQKKKVDKGNYKLNLSLDLMENGKEEYLL